MHFVFSACKALVYRASVSQVVLLILDLHDGRADGNVYISDLIVAYRFDCSVPLFESTARRCVRRRDLLLYQLETHVLYPKNRICICDTALVFYKRMLAALVHRHAVQHEPYVFGERKRYGRERIVLRRIVCDISDLHVHGFAVTIRVARSELTEYNAV